MTCTIPFALHNTTDITIMASCTCQDFSLLLEISCHLYCHVYRILDTTLQRDVWQLVLALSQKLFVILLIVSPSGDKSHLLHYVSTSDEFLSSLTDFRFDAVFEFIERCWFCYEELFLTLPKTCTCFSPILDSFLVVSQVPQLLQPSIQMHWQEPGSNFTFMAIEVRRTNLQSCSCLPYFEMISSTHYVFSDLLCSLYQTILWKMIWPVFFVG